MYIIFSKNNSIIESQLNDYINKGSDGVNFLDIVLYDNLNDRYCSPDEYTLTGAFLLPDGSTSLNATGVLNNSITTSLGTFEGYRFYFYEAFTQQSGDLKFSVVASFTDKTYVSHTQIFNVNDSAIYKNSTITWEEYENLMKTIADYQLQYSSTNVRGYASYDEAKEDLANLAVGQKVLVNTKSLQANPANELYEVIGDDEGNKALMPSTIGYKGLSNYYVWKFDSGTSETQSIYTGFVSRFYDTDGNARVLFGTDQVTDGYGFFANVLDASGNYSGAISLGAKNYKFAYDSAVDVFSSDGNTTAIKSPMGNASVELTNADSKVYGTNVYIGTKEAEESTDTSAGVLNLMNAIKLQGNAGLTINAWGDTQIKGGYWHFKTLVYFDQPIHCDNAPSADNQLANKSYVDKTADSKAAEYANIEKSRAEYYEGYLQDQVDAINKSQNFVATFATHQDLVNIDMSKLDYSDCVLILKDEDHNDQSTVYRYKGGSGGVLDMFEFVGELGDYYTKAQINDMFTNDQHIYVSEDGFVCVDYDKLPVRA